MMIEGSRLPEELIKETAEIHLGRAVIYLLNGFVNADEVCFRKENGGIYSTFLLDPSVRLCYVDNLTMELILEGKKLISITDGEYLLDREACVDRAEKKIGKRSGMVGLWRVTEE